MKRYRVIVIAILPCLAAVLACLPHALKAADTPPSPVVSKLLLEAKKQASLISADATLLRSYTGQSNLDWTTHGKQITRMKNHIDAAAKTVVALDELKSQAAPWQVAAISRILPYMREMAEDTTSAIEYLNKYQSRFSGQEYKDYVAANSDMSRELASLIAQFVDYGNSKGNYEKLQQKLELPGK
jgi:hypothetical protein